MEGNLVKEEVMAWLDAVIETKKELDRIKKFNSGVQIIPLEPVGRVSISKGIDLVAEALGERVEEEYDPEMNFPYHYSFKYKDVEVSQISRERLGYELDKEYILNRVEYQLINTGRNIVRLSCMPHRELLDLSVIYRVAMDEDGAGVAVSHALCDKYDISERELDIAARKNTKEDGFCVMPIAEIMADISGIPAAELQDGYQPMFILTNTAKNNGAAVMLYEEYFRELAGKLKSDLYVLPSSIHEVIAIPAPGFKPEELRKNIAEVNAKKITDKEFLSGNVYKYGRKEGKLEIA